MTEAQKIDDGGPAFPTGLNANPHNPQPDQDNGMSLRDWFAGQAMVGLIEGYDHEARMRSHSQSDRTGFDDHPHDDSDSTYASQLAGESYIIADAMLAARKAVGND